MRYLYIYIVLFVATTCFSQEQVTATNSTRYISSFECLVGADCIIDGDLDGEGFTIYMGFNQVFVDFENELITDYNIPYSYGCYLRNIMLDGKYLYLLGHSSLVIDIESRRMHDHFSFGEGLSFRDAEISGEGVTVRLVNTDSGRYHYGRYTPDTKEKLLSSSHLELISFEGNYYFTDSISGGFVLGEFTDEEWTENLIVGGEKFVYLGDGYFRLPDGRLSYGWLVNNPVFSCVPRDEMMNDIKANRIYVREEFNILESYDTDLQTYHYYFGDSCSYRKYVSSYNYAIDFDFFNDEYFGFLTAGNYVRMKHSAGLTSALEFTIASSEDFSSTDKWMMSGDTAYLITVRYVNSDFVHQLIRFTPNGFLESDNKTVIKQYPGDIQIERNRINASGNIELTFNNSVEGVHVVTLSPNGNQINNELLFYSWYHDYYEKNILWSANEKGHIRRTEIESTANYRIDRVEEGVVITDTMLMTPYIDEEIEVSLMENGGNQVLRFYDVINGTDSEIIINDININRQSRVIKVGTQIWLINIDNSEDNDVFRFGLDGAIIDELNLNVRKVISYDESGLMYSRRELTSSLAQVFHYSGEEVKQLSEDLLILIRNIVIGDKQYLLTRSSSLGTKIFIYNPESISLTELENFSEYPQSTEGVHNSLQVNRSFYAYEPNYYSSTIKHILFDEQGYKIEEFDLGETLFVDYTTSFPYKQGFIYSVRDNMTNVYVDANGAKHDIPINLEDNFLISDIQQIDESVYLFGGSYYDVYVVKCDDEFNDCELITNFDLGNCQYKDIQLLGKNNGDIYFSAASNNPIETIWVLDSATDEIYLYNTDEETQIQFFERRDFLSNGYVYFTAAKYDQEHQLYRLKVSDGPNAIETVASEYTFNVYPNLVSGSSIIRTNITIDHFSLYDISGSEILRGSFENGKYQLPELMNGYYILKGINSKGIQLTSSIIVLN